ncbi:MAG: hypothetical protein JSW39_01935, partial [Desulfobacterales bacterium]
LKISYGVTIALLLLTVVITPFLVKNKRVFSEKFIMEEDAVEALLILTLLFTAYFVTRLYRSELKKNQQALNRLTHTNSDLSDRLTDAFKYIGGVNVEIQEIRSILSGLKRYPVTKNDFKNVFALFARKIFSIANADWVVIRIINRTNFRTITEQIEFRENASFSSQRISNKAIVLRQNMDGYLIITSRQENLTLKCVCILPDLRLNTDEKIMVEAIANQIEMLYIIFNSQGLKEMYVKA